MVENEYSINKQEVAKYFPLQSTVKGMLQIFEKLFGLVFVEVTSKERDNISETGKGDDIIWHKDAKLFSVWNDKGEGGNFAGYLYLNLHLRPRKFSSSHTYPL
jgi:metallopeptidase MepB